MDHEEIEPTPANRVKLFLLKSQNKYSGPDVVAHACNLALWEAEAGRSQGQEFEISLANMVKPHLY